jgi:hypothetical protein
VLLQAEPGRETIDQVVLEQLREPDPGDVPDLLLGIVARILVSLLLEAELVTGTRIGGQVRDQFGVFPIPEPNLQT